MYAMVGPDNEKHWARVDYTRIQPERSFESKDSFCDENGQQDHSMPSMNWNNQFTTAAEGTQVHIIISFEQEAHFQAILKMGFEEGFTAGLSNLDEVLATARV
ncbi:MAG: SRPBCC domain-containing protein [Pedobacter sp.]|nr:MAG: SRPBCC domain-containing protein [Pedobacter sp.]